MLTFTATLELGGKKPAVRGGRREPREVGAARVIGTLRGDA